MIYDEFTGEVQICLPNGTYVWYDSHKEAQEDLDSYHEWRYECERNGE